MSLRNVIDMKKTGRYIWITFCILAISILVFEVTNIDIYIQDHFYNFETKQWILAKTSVIPKLIFYDGVKLLYVLFVIAILTILLFFRHRPIVVLYKNGLLIVLLSCVLIPLLINSLKAVTNVPCPDNIRHYGGNYPYVTVLSKYPPTFHATGNIKCYPAGHASGGFALMSLFFLFMSKRNKTIALVSAISIGWTIGIYKMIIGDHFFSHTFVSMIISWLVILLIAGSVNHFNYHRA